MDKELLYNQSGIKDITAYKAISNLGKRGTGNMNGYEINKGEVWQAISGEREIYVVVLACFDRYATTIMLQEQEPTSNAVPVRVRDIMYADAGRLGYVYYDKMVDYVRRLSTGEDQELRQAIAVAMELEVTVNPVSATTAALEERDKAREAAQLYENIAAEAAVDLEAAQKEVDYLRMELAKAKEEATTFVAELEYAEPQPCIRVEELVENKYLREDLAAVRREAEIYKGLYESILSKVLG